MLQWFRREASRFEDDRPSHELRTLNSTELHPVEIRHNGKKANLVAIEARLRGMERQFQDPM